MINIKEKMMPPVEEEEKEEEEEEEEEEGDKGETSSDDGSGNEDDEEGREGETSSGVADEAEESSSHGAGEKVAPSAQVEKEKDVLNLNNEVVKMRKEVKRVKALIIRKLTRQIGALKKKKGKEAEVERNQKRAMRLLEEVHCMKKLRPDQVTKTALQKNLNFEQVCKNPKSTISDRAVARIATHPQFNKKIESLKAAVKTFKEERSKGGKQGGQAKVQSQPEKVTLPFPDAKVEKESPKIQDGDAVEPEEGADSEKGVGVPRVTEDRAAASAGKEIKKAAREVHGKESTCVKPPPVKKTLEKDPVKHEAQSESEENNSDLRTVPTVLDIETDEEESDVELSDNEAKEYFDDSTEERFHKQSSQSEESDDDDFFVGKVSKFKKKKKKQTDVDRGQEGKKEPSGNVRARDKLQHELESRLKSKAATLQSVFCSSLARTKAGRGSDRRQGGGKSTDQGKPGVASRVKGDCLDKQPNRSQEKGASNSRSKFSKPYPDGMRPDFNEKGGRGRGRGRGEAQRGKDRGGGVFDFQPPLHPSWEASKKRKEQQGQILAFQGKKIKFDDDDD